MVFLKLGNHENHDGGINEKRKKKAFIPLIN